MSFSPKNNPHVGFLPTTNPPKHFFSRSQSPPQEATADAEQRWAEEALAEVQAAEELAMAEVVEGAEAEPCSLGPVCYEGMTDCWL